MSGDDFKNKALKVGFEDIKSDKRAIRLRKDLEDYAACCQQNLLDHVVLNDFNYDSMIKQLSPILNKQDTIIKNQIFLAMSYSSSMDDCYESINTACQLLNTQQGININLIRSDKQSGDHKITEKMIKDIEQSEFIICDLTDEKQNVYWDLGYARGIKKKTMTIIKEGSKLHFDVQDFNVIKYK